MRHPVLRTGVLATLTAVFLGLAVPPIAGGESASRADLLPACPAPQGAPGGPAPAGVPSVDDPGACRAEPTQVEPADTGQLPVPRPGYHHLGATTAGEWSGIKGRLTVQETGVRDGRFDFVATRFLAKQDGAGGGQLTWIEVGWADTGWSGDGTPRIYAFDSEAMAWAFFDEYRLRGGDRVWVYLHQEEATWQAWLWWGGRWRLLAAPQLPMGEAAQLEQYVEVHLDPKGGNGSPIPVPPIRVDSVQVAAAPGASFQNWRPDRVPTVIPDTSTDYCLTWEQQYNAWSASEVPCKGGS